MLIVHQNLYSSPFPLVLTLCNRYRRCKAQRTVCPSDRPTARPASSGTRIEPERHRELEFGWVDGVGDRGGGTRPAEYGGETMRMRWSRACGPRREIDGEMPDWYATDDSMKNDPGRRAVERGMKPVVPCPTVWSRPTTAT